MNFKGHHFRHPHFGNPQRGYGVLQKSKDKKENIDNTHEDIQKDEVKDRDNETIPKNIFNRYYISDEPTKIS